MTSKLYLDSETCGLHSMMVLLQIAVEDGPIELHDIWLQPIRETLDRIEKICEHTVVGFNLVFDWFHIAKVYTIFRLANPDWIPIEHINELALLEPAAQDGPCVKPAGALDLMLHSRKGPYQSLMAREDVRIRRVPAVLAYSLAAELENRVQLDGIYFARSRDKDAPRWQVRDRKNRDGEIDREFKDVVLKFNPAGGLKFLAEHAMGYKPKFHYANVEPDRDYLPIEYGFAPTALAVSTPDKNWEIWKKNAKGDQILAGYAWPGVIKHFVSHWSENKDAREYATDDIVYTRALDGHFGFPTPNDDDSILACMVPVIRWHGFTINVEGMKGLMKKAEAVVAASPVNINKPPDVRAYIAECMDDTEFAFIETSTNKKNLEKVQKFIVKTGAELAKAVAEQAAEEDAEVLGTDGIDTWDDIKRPEHCLKCNGNGSHENGKCMRCGGLGHMVPGPHPAAVRAKEILDVKHAAKEKELYAKLIHAKKFHASFDVIGALSSRMSGKGGDLNPQGIKNDKEVRSMFPLAWEHYVLCGGDFDSFEVTLADAVYDDKTLRLDLMSGKKIHALFAMQLFPGVTYEDIMSEPSESMYKKGKTAIFGMIYGGDWTTLVKNLSICEELAKEAFNGFNKRYPGIAKAREKTFKAFCSMQQPGGQGSAVVWAEPSDFIETFLGFRRYFTLENKICKVLFDLARKPPKGWADCKHVKVVRSNRVQTAGGAAASALYGAAFAMQAMNMRAAANHEIQSPGGQITKTAQRAIWDIQPVGVHQFLVAPMNVHDELMCSTHPSVVSRVTNAVRTVVESFRPKVPLIGMSWFEAMKNWAEKKDGAEKVKIRCHEMMDFD